MNIFYLDQNPLVAAFYMCDKHVIQMIRESAQLLATAHRVLDGKEVKDPITKKTRWVLDSEFESLIPQATHRNHPSSIWVRQSTQHYDWLWFHFSSLLSVYTDRYNKIHLFQQFKEPLANDPINLPRGCFLDPPQCMPDEFKCEDTIQAYRNFYIGSKSRFAKWNHSAVPPWWPNQAGNGFLSDVK